MAANFIINSMFRILKKVICAMLGFAALQQASAFSVFGPLEDWQTTTLDYGTRYYYGNDIELGGSKNFNEGSRLNIPIVTYAYDYTFLSYFGAEGVAAVDSAMAELNALPIASRVNLSKYLLQDNQAINYTAQALALTDIKSTVMSLMLEHMGLQGESHVWDLRFRDPTPVTCDYFYDVINRNYDPVTYDPTAYVNGVQVGYTIWDGCTAGIQVADAIEAIVDQNSIAQYVFTAVATRYGQQIGGYYLGLTQDDVGGLAFLYNPTNFAYESLDANSVAVGSTSSPWEGISTGISNAAGAYEGLFGGVEKVTYVKVAYDSLLGAAFSPRSYNYTIPLVTNGTMRLLHATRTITAPDIIFAAADLTVTPDSITPDNYPNAYIRTFNFVASPLVTTGVTPVINAVIAPQEVITFNDGPPAYVNIDPNFLDSQYFAFYPTLQWASFDGSTNAPVVFPNYSSIVSLEEEILTSGNSVSFGLWDPLSVLNPNAITTTTTTAP
jgi:hypothetical protein